MSDLGNKEVMSKNIQKYMKRQGITRNKMVDDLGFKYSTLRDWIKGKTYPRIDKIEEMAKYFNINKSDLIENKSNPENDFVKINAKDFVNVPLLGEIACGEPITAEQNIEGYIPTEKTDIPGGVVFWLTCKGQSMSPTLPDGSKVLVHEQPEVEDGEMAAVLIDDEATLKRVKHIDGNKILLMPDNNSYEPILLDGSNNAKILGKVIEMKMKF